MSCIASCRRTPPSYPCPSSAPVRRPVGMVDMVGVGLPIPHMFRIFELPCCVPWGLEEWGGWCVGDGLGAARPFIGTLASRLARCYRVPWGVLRVPILWGCDVGFC